MIKRDNPEYSQYSDEEIGIRMKGEYPEKYQEYITPQMEDLFSYYHPNKGVFRNWLARRRRESGTKLSVVINDELATIINRAAMLEDAALSSRRKYIEFQTFIVQNEYALIELRHKEKLLEDATDEGMTPEHFSSANYETRLSNNRIKEKESETVILKYMSDLRISEFKEIEAIKLNNELKLRQERVRLSLIAKTLSNQQRMILVQELLDDLYKQIEQVEATNLKPATKQRMIDDREAIITSFKGFQDAEGNRLLGPHTR